MMNNDSDCDSHNVLCCFSTSSAKKRKRRKLSQPHMSTPQTETANTNALTTTKRKESTRNSQLPDLPKEDLFHKFNSARSSNEFTVAKQKAMTSDETKRSYNSENRHTNDDKRVVSKDGHSNSNNVSSVYLVNDKHNSNSNTNAYSKQCQHTLSSLMDDGNELTSSQVLSNLNASSSIKDNRLDISAHVISAQKMPAQHKQSSFRKHAAIESKKTLQDHNKARFASCDNQLTGGHVKGLRHKIAKKIKEIDGIKDKISEIADIVVEYEDKTQKIIRRIEKEENDAQILVYMLNYLLNERPM